MYQQGYRPPQTPQPPESHKTNPPRVKKKAIIFLGIAAFFFLISISLFGRGDVGPAIVSLAISGALAFTGHKTAPKKGINAEIANTEQAKPTPAPTQSPYEFLKFKVAGVTFKDGRFSRQTYLRRFYFKEEPFDAGTADLTMREEEYEGKPAFAILLNERKIGYVPANLAPYVDQSFDRVVDFSDIDVYRCGGDDYKFGAEVTMRLRRQ